MCTLQNEVPTSLLSDAEPSADISLRPSAHARLPSQREQQESYEQLLARDFIQVSKLITASMAEVPRDANCNNTNEYSLRAENEIIEGKIFGWDLLRCMQRRPSSPRQRFLRSPHILAACGRALSSPCLWSLSRPRRQWSTDIVSRSMISGNFHDPVRRTSRHVPTTAWVIGFLWLAIISLRRANASTMDQLCLGYRVAAGAAVASQSSSPSQVFELCCSAFSLAASAELLDDACTITFRASTTSSSIEFAVSTVDL